MRKTTWDDFAPLNTGKYTSFRQISYAGSSVPQQTLYLSVPDGKHKVPLLVFFHGGDMIRDSRNIPDKVYNGELAVVIRFIKNQISI